MNFISVRRLAVVFKLEFSSIDDELIENIEKSIDQHFKTNKVLSAFGQYFSQKELVFVLNELQEDKVRVFHDWIEKDHFLVEYLFTHGETVLHNLHVVLAQEDDFFIEYQDFLSTYLAPILIQKTYFYITKVDIVELKHHLKLSPLLPTDKRIEIEQPVNSYLKQLLAQTKVSHGKELHEQLNLVYSDEFVDLLNALDNHFYPDVLNYINTAKLIVQRNDLSPLLLDRIKSAVLGLDLKEEDQNNALTFINASSFTSRSKVPKSSLNEMVKSPFFVVAVILLVINFVFLRDCEGESIEIKPLENFSDTIHN